MGQSLLQTATACHGDPGESSGLQCWGSGRRGLAFDLVPRAKRALVGCGDARAHTPAPSSQNPLSPPEQSGLARRACTAGGARRAGHPQPCIALEIGSREGVRRAALGSAWADLLGREAWQWFGTFTFSPSRWLVRGGKRVEVERYHPLRGVHPEAAMKSWRWFVHELNASLYGKHWKRRGDGGLVWVCGQEFHKSGKVHFHTLLGAPNMDLNAAASRYAWHEVWFREFGRNQIEVPKCQGDVARYVSKYVAKDGEIEFSPNFGAVRPLRMFDAEPAVWQAVGQL